MFAVRFAGLLALTIWVGGLVILGGIAAPAAFDVLAAREAPDARMLAGAVFGEALRRFHLVAYACGGAIVVTLALRAVLGPRPRRFGLRIGIAALMLAAALVSGFVVSPRIERAQQEAGVAPSALPAGDPLRVRFGRLHGASTALQLVPLLGGLVLLWWELKD